MRKPMTLTDHLGDIAVWVVYFLTGYLACLYQDTEYVNTVLESIQRGADVRVAQAEDLAHKAHCVLYILRSEGVTLQLPEWPEARCEEKYGR